MEESPAENEVDASPFFTGPIAEAIKIAKAENKNLIVYIAGKNEDSLRMDQTTWKDHKVQKVIREEFVTLRLPQDSSDAAHFFAMYPCRGVPSISVINNSGMLLNQLDGYIQPEELFGMLEKTLAIQAAATIVAALASANTGTTSLPTQSQANNFSTASENLESQDGGSSSAMHDNMEPCCPSTTPTVEKFEDNDIVEKLEDNDIGQIGHLASSSQAGGGERKYPTQKQTAVTKSEQSEEKTEQVHGSTSCDPLFNAAESRDLNTETDNQMANMDASVSLKGKVSSSCQEAAPKIRQPAEMFLIQVRLTNGKSIRKSFNPKDNLAVVKEFVDQNRDDGNDIYSLAMLYPRIVFSQEDMEKSLLELSLEDRATLVLVTSPSQPKFPASGSSRKQETTPEVKETVANGGIWKILSYMNPLSYFSGNNDSSKNSEPGSSSWQYEPNPHLRNSLRQGVTDRDALSNRNANETNASKAKKSPERNWGGNIHTLQHNDNDEAFKRGNTFWNGNSTQFGGDDSQK